MPEQRLAMAIKFSQIFQRLNEIGEKMRHQFFEMQFIFENKCIKYNKPDTTNNFVILHILVNNPVQLYKFYKKFSTIIVLKLYHKINVLNYP